MNKVDEINDFWFGMSNRVEYGRPRSMWFRADSIIDREIKERFAETYQFAAAGLLGSWQDDPSSCVALIITLDQFPRNMFRGEAKAFASDEIALDSAKQAIKIGSDRMLLPVQRWFMYLPFEHSENIEDQVESVRLFETLASDTDSQIAIDSAHTHYKLIKRFGRFPHRNQILGRTSTPTELEFLASPGAFHG
jgi:uncharacterized protein (DUF924 family)